MRILETLAQASVFTSPRWRSAISAGREEEGTLWRYLSEQTYFLNQTGQAYRFEDYLSGIPTTSPPYVSAALATRNDGASQRALTLALETLSETPEPEQARHLRVLINILNFLAETGQVDDFEDYLNNRREYAPLAIASFATRDEAEAWLKGLDEPPSPVRILIGDAYHLAWYSREDGTRDLSCDYVMEPYIKELTARGIPPDEPSFTSRKEAEDWLRTHPASPFAFVSIEGAHYVAVHHKKLKRHTLHSVAASLSEWEEASNDTDRLPSLATELKSKKEDE